MLEVIIFGTGKLSEVVEACLKHNIVNVKCYSDNDESKWGKEFQGKEIVNPSKLFTIKYDYIIIASQYNEEIYSQLIRSGVQDKKIFEFGVFFKNVGELYPRDRIEKFVNNKEIYECIITGISYTLTGIDIESLKYKAYTFANGSQDLFYDYKIAKYVIEHVNYNIKYCIIGLSYYSFQYDLSLSNMKSRVNGYYEFFKDYHNAYDIKENRSDINKKIGSLIINFKSNQEITFEKPLILFENSVNKEETGRRVAESDCNKSYPRTVEENKIIFKDYIEFLKQKNIEPIVLIFPASKYYTKYFSNRIEEEFIKIINGFRSEYNFKYIDFFRSELFQDKDFGDISHLNIYGAKKFTTMLNGLI